MARNSSLLRLALSASARAAVSLARASSPPGERRRISVEASTSVSATSSTSRTFDTGSFRGSESKRPSDRASSARRRTGRSRRRPNTQNRGKGAPPEGHGPPRGYRPAGEGGAAVGGIEPLSLEPHALVGGER